MASIGREGDQGELKRLVFRDSKGKQKSLRLGECSERAAEQALAGFERVLQSHRTNTTLHPDGVRWLERIDDRLHARVVKLGLTEPRKRAESVTLGALLDRFDAAGTVKPSTRVKYQQVAASLRAILGAETPLDSITPADADNWRKTIAEPIVKRSAKPDAKGETSKTPARATIAKRVVIAKGVFRKAMRWGLIPSNPFAELRAGSQSNPDRAFYIGRETIGQILAVCPDDEWRAIIALSRYAGLRCPSEILALRWGDVNWERGRLMVRSVKTEGHEGHAVRVVPIAPELRPILQDLFDHAEVGAEAVVPRLRDPKVNLRTQFERIIGAAGVKPWPRLFHNMRASCATDWVERFPAHVVAGWLGHSPMIAAQHYLQTRDAHFDLAAGMEQAAAIPATQARRSDPTASESKKQNPHNSRELVGIGTACDSVENQAMPPEGLEPSTR